MEEFKEFKEFEDARGARSQNPGAGRRCVESHSLEGQHPLRNNGTRNRGLPLITEFLIAFGRLDSPMLERSRASWLLDSGSWLLLQLAELL
jgi:hypothetical protein